MLNAVGSMGLVSVYVDATSTSFHFYFEGVMYVQGCSTTQLSHALTVIGYGFLNGKEYSFFCSLYCHSTAVKYIANNIVWTLPNFL